MNTNVNAKMATLVTRVKLSPIIAKTVHVKTMEHVSTREAIILVCAAQGTKEDSVISR